MKVLIPADGTLKKICGEQKTTENKYYRINAHCIDIPVEEGHLLFHTLTGELLLLSDTEWREKENGSIRRELIRRWYLVPIEHDEKKHADEIFKVMRLLQKNDKVLRSFTILTTLDCNARCFYCYELGGARTLMDRKTAYETADFIIRASQGKKVSLIWFGGEPLYNSDAIDQICERLCDAGVEFSSRMVSNGYLFDSDLVQHAKSQWKLERVQITLDGTEEIYNRTKGFIYHDGSAYRRVLRNIGLLLDAEIRVIIRLNMNRDNADDLIKLVQELSDCFYGKKGLTVYTALLHQFGKNSVGAFEDDCSAFSRYCELTERIWQLGLGKEKSLQNTVKLNCCMADSDNSILILPDGRLGKCEHETEKNLIGSIRDDSLDNSTIQMWKEPLKSDKCGNCPLYPRCMKLKHCAQYEKGCHTLDKEIVLYDLRTCIEKAYKRIKEGEPTLSTETETNDSQLC